MVVVKLTGRLVDGLYRRALKKAELKLENVLVECM